jgi:signal peptidase I
MASLFSGNGKRRKSVAKPAWRQWVEAAIFAMLVVAPIHIFGFQLYHIPSGSMESSLLTGDYVFVNKWSYGARLPMTPLAVPFVQNTFLGFPSFITALQFGYHRLPGTESVRRNDVVVFNFPAGDTVIALPQFGSAVTYYETLRMLGREQTWRRFGDHIVVRPIDKEENFIKRCVAVPGDTLRIVRGRMFINHQPAFEPQFADALYAVQTNGEPFNTDRLKELDIKMPRQFFDSAHTYLFNLTRDQVIRLKQFSNVRRINPYLSEGAAVDVFPHDTARFAWNLDNFGPLYIPRRGATIPLDAANLALYGRIIATYEGNSLKTLGDTVWINGKKTSTYTFGKNYYWMMGDNRGESLDSRFWGFVPEDHIVGKPMAIYFSKGEEGIRWSRLFRTIQ